jgi:hypothetical protein
VSKLLCHTKGRKYFEVLLNKVLKRIFGPKSKEVIGDWIKLHNDELHDLYYSALILWTMKSKRMVFARQRNSAYGNILKSERK